MQQSHVARCASGRAQSRAALTAKTRRWQARRGALGGAAQGAAAAPRAPEVPPRPRLRVLQPPERLATLLLQCIQARARGWDANALQRIRARCCCGVSGCTRGGRARRTRRDSGARSAGRSCRSVRKVVQREGFSRASCRF